MMPSTPLENRNQIVKAFSQLVETRRAMGANIATKEELAQRQKDQEIIQTAALYTVETIVKGLADVQLDFGTAFDGLSTKLTTESEKLDQLRRAITVERQNEIELRNIHTAADALDILKQEHQERLKTFETDAQNRRDQLERETVERRAQWQKEQTEFETADEQYFDNLKKEREQAEEEFRYELERRRQAELDAYVERKRKTERENEDLGKRKEKAWAERERVLAERQPKLDEYRQKIETIPAELETAIKKAREDAIKETYDAEKFKASLLEKETAASEKLHELRVQSLESTIERNNAHIAELTAELQIVMKQAQELAMKAVQGTSKTAN